MTEIALPIASIFYFTLIGLLMFGFFLLFMWICFMVFITPVKWFTGSIFGLLKK